MIAAASAGWQPAKFEEEFHGIAVAPPVRLRGKIDRLDLSTDKSRARVLDYKTGKLPRGVRDDSLAGGEALQLPLYILAAQQILPNVAVESASYLYFTLRGGYRTITFTRGTLDNRRAELTGLLETASEMIRRGIFAQYATAEGCRHCDFRPICGNGILKLYELKQDAPAMEAFRAIKEEVTMTRPVDHAAREAAANDLDTTFFVEAAAGTGKTTALVARIVSVVSNGRARLSEIVAITFTEKAAGELKMRLREELEKNLKGNKLRDALADLERAHITTIHAFCAWILRERPIEAVVDPQFAVADELQRQLLFEEAWEKWLEEELAKNPAALRQALMFGVELDTLSELAALLVDHRDRLESAKLPEPELLDVDSLLGELESAAPSLERCLAHFTARSENAYVRARTLLDTLPLLQHASAERKIAILRSLELTGPRAKVHLDGEEAFREMKDTVKNLGSLLKNFTMVADHNLLVGLVTWLRGFVDHFQKVKHDRALLDFDDLLLKTRDLLRNNTDARSTLQQRFKFVLVDEFQDTDPVQTEVVLLLGEGAPGKLFVVGDPKQSIYGFRRADIEMYADTRRQIERHGKSLTFRQNFRSKSTILDWVNDVFAKILVKSGDGDYQPEYIPLAPSAKLRTDQALVTLLRPKEFVKASAEELRRAEATAIARYLRQQVASGICKWGDVALLFRSFTGIETYGDVLQQHGVPFRVIGGKSYYQRQEIQTLSSLLSCLDNPADKLNLVAVLRSPLFGWADEQIFLTSETNGLDYLKAPASRAPEQVQQTFALLRELHGCRRDFSVAGYVEHAFARTRICEAFFASQPDGAQSVANLLKALELARQLEAAGCTLAARIRPTAARNGARRSR